MSDDLVKRLDNLWTMLDEEGLYTKANTVTLAKSHIEELEAKLAQVTAAYRIEVMQRGPWVSHEDFDRHIREITGDYDE